MRCIQHAFLLIAGLSGVFGPIGTLEAQTEPGSVTILLPARVFDAEAGSMRDGWAVMVKGDRIQAVGRRSGWLGQQGPRRSSCPARRCCPA